MASVMEGTKWDRTNTALVLSAGAPHSPLMAGALAALYHDHKKTFNVVYTSGAGTLIGLLFVAPKDKSPDEALRAMVDLGVSDAIYRFLPIGYKAFFKPGPFTQPIHRWAQRFKLGNSLLRPIDKPITLIGHAYNDALKTFTDADGGKIKRTYNDLVDLWAAVITPPMLAPWSKGISPPLPFLEDLVDFDKLRDSKVFEGEFYANAFKVAHASEGEEGKSGLKAMLFEKGVITAEHVRATFAFPFIYEPVWMNGEHYFEGANRDPINFGNLLTNTYTRQSVKTIVLIDILASLDRHLLRPPRSLWDAYGLSIMAPVVANAKKEITRFRRALEFYKKHKEQINFTTDHPEYLGGYPEDYRPLTFNIPDELGEHLTEWSYSNLSKMFEIGYEQGKKFWDDEKNADLIASLPPHKLAEAKPAAAQQPTSASPFRRS